MMETKNKRTRAWRRHQARRVFKARLKRVGAEASHSTEWLQRRKKGQ